MVTFSAGPACSIESSPVRFVSPVLNKRRADATVAERRILTTAKQSLNHRPTPRAAPRSSPRSLPTAVAQRVSEWRECQSCRHPASSHRYSHKARTQRPRSVPSTALCHWHRTFPAHFPPPRLSVHTHRRDGYTRPYLHLVKSPRSAKESPGRHQFASLCSTDPCRSL